MLEYLMIKIWKQSDTSETLITTQLHEHDVSDNMCTLSFLTQ
jgi:hypothetical protein